MKAICLSEIESMIAATDCLVERRRGECNLLRGAHASAWEQDKGGCEMMKKRWRGREWNEVKGSAVRTDPTGSTRHCSTPQISLACSSRPDSSGHVEESQAWAQYHSNSATALC